MDTVQIALYVVPALVTFLLGIALRHKLISKATLSELMVYGQLAVKAAEVAYAELPQSGEAKLQHAMTAMTTKFGITPEEARTIILATVDSMNRQGLLGTPKKAAPVAVITPNNPEAS